MIGRRHRAFSLLELAVVLALSGMMMGYMFSVIDDVDSSQKSGCAVSTRAQLNYIRAQIEAFARNNDRLPLPSRRDIALGSGYGVEDDGSHITNVAGTSWGALPFMTLGLGSAYTNDCWGNKFTYAVTTALTTNNTSGGYLDSTVLGNMALKNAAASTVNDKIAYAIISHGRDELGAVKVSYAVDGTPNWCTGSTDIAYTNCLADSATIMNAPFNDGKDAGANYFDDVVVASGRPVVLSAASGYYAFGWGSNSVSVGAIVGNDHISRTSPSYVIGGISFSKITTGSNHNCGLTAAGVAYCWGDNTYGQLGTGDTVKQASPTAVTGGYSFNELSAGQNHTCGITTTGDAYCWGQNLYRQLGTGDVVARWNPALVSGSYTFSAIAAGASHTCAVTTGDDAICWGYNYRGQAGNGSTTALMVGVNPTPVIGGFKFKSITVGGAHSCALTAAGAAYCWGYNGTGQVGIGSVVTPKTTPVPVIGGHTFSNLRSHAQGVCGLRTTGEIYCWGQNTFAECGIGNTLSPQSTPIAVTGGYTFSKIAEQGLSSNNCGITTSGAAYCWGQNNYGQLGDGTITNPRSSPVAVTGGYTFSSIAEGASHSCGITTSGGTYCWGYAENSQLGNNTYQVEQTKSPTRGGIKFSSAQPGNIHACGLDSKGAAYCWGDNTYGELGNGNAVTQGKPVAVTGGLTFSKIAVGSFHTCALTTAGAAYCWGYNGNGGLGIGVTDFGIHHTPEAVLGGLTFSSIAVGYLHTCAITTAGAAYCWGYNLYGNLGDGTSGSPANDRTSPTPVLGGLTFSNIALGNYNSCGITTTNAAYCWGLNTQGQTGNGGVISPQSSPTPVAGGYSFSTISIGYGHACALTTTGAAYCWGYNNNGQVGIGSTASPQSSPVPVLGGYTFSSISAGYYHTCGIATGDTAYCWGYNVNGQTGNGNLTSPQSSPVQVVGSGTAPYKFKAIMANANSGGSTLALADTTGGCTWPDGIAGSPNTGSDIFYQSATPTGACVPEWRTCTSGVLSGSYTQTTCSPGCDARTETWNGVANGCTAAVPALAGGGSAVITDAIGSPTGTATANCSVTGVLTLSGTTCNP